MILLLQPLEGLFRVKFFFFQIKGLRIDAVVSCRDFKNFWSKKQLVSKTYPPDLYF